MPDLSKSAPLGPMTIGNVISSTVILYRTHWRDYLSLSLQSSAWIILPLVIGILGVAALITLEVPWLIFAGLPFWLGGFIYCWGRSLTYGGAIARMGVCYLADVPESVQKAYRWARSRLLALMGVNILLGLIFVAVYLAVVIGLGIIAFIVAFLLMAVVGVSFGSTTEPPILLGVLLFLLFMAGLGITIMLFLWVTARFTIFDLPLMVEAKQDAIQSLKKSWQLTQGNAFRIMGIVAIATLVTLPIMGIFQTLTFLIQVFVSLWINNQNQESYAAGLSVLFSWLVGAVSSIILLPLWQSLKAVLYYDLKSRQEGIDLTLDAPRLRGN
ncbi:glycerophosphoryl diester phosphodiesterase membrane domain-containing protein [Spirulina sp. CCNP1310]|uniref:glycerophosphoryl diester phosphodiesterase membrane domain-containing protein n=1 Tax=Spirulina sp. CCNP1310 TaxID=3110249 RepID=UPI002B1EA08E|nr:glycerophosphoryl diester phosphodiesterase membrane domain-containing protein [Spirulina sp. CCNP1310]MEA5421528.1 glycerophosphoryl diester phosphodiesterase membrane domain-containing protein [Spirulina sp. CCNP1310]